MFSNTLQVIRHHVSSAVGDLLYGQCGITGADTTHTYAPFLWQPNDYYNDHYYEVYVYAGTNKGVTKRITDWVLSTFLMTVHSAYAAACDATSYIELHHIFMVDELNKAINLAIDSIADKYLIDKIDETTVLVADTYEYTLPTDIYYIHKITTVELAGGGTFEESAVIDPRDYRLISPRKLKLDERQYGITAGKDLRIEGQGRQDVLTADTGICYLPLDWVKAEAILRLPLNKIQSNKLDSVLAQARVDAVSYRATERNSPNPCARKVVE